jgi:uncharacterized membrane protein
VLDLCPELNGPSPTRERYVAMIDLTRAESEQVPAAQLAGPAGSKNGASPSAPDISERSLAQRALWTMVGVGLLVWASALIGTARHTWTIGILVFCNIWGLSTIVATWLPENRWTTNRRLTNTLAWVTAFITAGTVIAWGVASLKGGIFYGTDEIAFDQYAAQLVQKGLNPYTHSMKPAYQLFQVPTNYYTYSFVGKPVTSLSYPSLSFLIYVPFLLLGWSYNLAPALCLVAWGLTTIMLFATLPRSVRPLGLLFGGTMLYASYAVGGVTDAMYMPLLIVAAYKWDRFGTSRWTYIGPVMFGLAMCIKQTPWIALPFMLLALGGDEYIRSGLAPAVKRVGKYLGVAVATFLVPNLPYIIASPHAWLTGVFEPLSGKMVPTGQGTVSLSLYFHIGGGSMTAFTLATVFTGLLLIVAFVGTYPLLRVAMLFIPSFVLLFGARSNVNYFISLIPVAVVAAITCGPAPVSGRAVGAASGLAATAGRGALAGWRRLVTRASLPWGGFRSRFWAIGTAVCTVLFVGAVVRSLTAAPPIKISIIGVKTTGNTNHIQAITLRVSNTSSKAVSPGFDTVQSEYNSTFWRIARGPQRLPAHTTVDYELISTNAQALPSIYGGFNMVGYIPQPASFSVSRMYAPSLLGLTFDPPAENKPLPVGQAFTLSLDLVNHLGARLHRAGVLVSLKQVIWSQAGPRMGQARINGGPVGMYAVVPTNTQGVAKFHIVGAKPTGYNSVSFTAFLHDPNFHYIYSASGNFDLGFVAR